MIKTKNKYQKLFSPRSIAIVGASNKKGTIGNVLVKNITKLGYAGEVFFVNPSYNILNWKRCYKSLENIKRPVDLAIIAIPAKFVIETIEKAAGIIKNYIVISAGFSEIGEDGARHEKELATLAKKYKLNILGPNCLGFIAPKLKLNASFAGGMPAEGNIAFVSQSGALAVALMDRAKEEHLGFSNIISVGNKMEIDETELLEYLLEDKKTKVIGMYLEGIKNGRKFLEIAKKASLKKPIVILKAGKTAKAQQAISSHTGALAGSDEIVDVAFKSAGIIRANNLEEFFNLLGMISFTQAPKNNKVAVVTNAGGAGVLTTDAFKGKEIELAELDKKVKEELKKQLPSESSVENPIDLLGDAHEDRYRNILKLINKKNIGSVICVLTPQEQTPVEKIASSIVEAKKNGDSLVLTAFIGGERTKEAALGLKQNNIPNFSDPESAVNALDKYYKWNVFSKTKTVSSRKNISAKRRKQIAEIIGKAAGQKRTALLFPEAAEIMQKYGIDCVQSWAVLPNAGAPEIFCYPLAVKVDSDKVLHKSDKQALILNLKNKKALDLAIRKLQKDFPGTQLVIQAMQDKQVEIILGDQKR